jgi:hypothetical protein
VPKNIFCKKLAFGTSQVSRKFNRCRVACLWLGQASEGLRVERKPAGCQEIRRNFRGPRKLAVCEMARKTRQLAISPLATITVGWVPDPHTGGRSVSAGLGAKAQSCAGGLPTDNPAKGESQPERWVGFLTLCLRGSKQGFRPFCEVAVFTWHCIVMS